MNKNKNKIAVFGANGSLGNAFIKHFDKLDNSELFSFSRDQLINKYKGINHTIIGDYNDDSVAESAEKFDDYFFDMVIICIGILHNQKLYPEKRIEEFKEEQFKDIMNINLVIPILIAKHFHKKIKKNKRSIMAILSARVGSISDNKAGGWYSYRASKAALNMVVKNMSIEFGRNNKELIIVGLHPGTVDSFLSQPFQKNMKKLNIFTPDYSVSKLSTVIDNLSNEDSGNCFAWDGTVISP